MTDRNFRAFPDPVAADMLGLGPSPGRTLFENEFFDAPPPAGDALYIGADGQAVVHLAARTPAQIYAGARQLYP
jgi:hypothetical protein